MSITNPVDKAILNYLKRHPNSKPREIADALGFSLVVVRSSLYRLRERGLVARTSRGYIAKGDRKSDILYGEENVIQNDVSRSRLETLEKEINSLKDRVSEIERSLQDFGEVIQKIEKNLAEIRLTIRSLRDVVNFGERKKSLDPFISKLLTEKILGLNEARRLASEGLGSLDKYVEDGVAVVIGKIVVSREFYESIIMRMPINVEEVNQLGPKEKILIETLISEGLAYIDNTHMIKIVSE
jgi:DNA-binding Lrp family transcriptional regulator